MALTALLLRPELRYTLNLLPSFSNYTVPVKPISSPGSLDGAKANFSVNASTSDFWYFNTQPGVVGDSTALERAPAYYLYTLNEPNVSEELLRYIYWANAVPSAAENIDIFINGESISFVNGVSYNDKN
ncbi:hypothetical protein CSIM01_00888 [Colletotrichum simmondsii]|uniref:Uncharacterized protein n=1 Tax=Colletotrichum simmondsii TaxID=703756 RepID=A0A135S2M1_9PEZI|nr:hypothetical protein CSIM01_00888 [Colletotrichum simmondsii]